MLIVTYTTPKKKKKGQTSYINTRHLKEKWGEKDSAIRTTFYSGISLMNLVKLRRKEEVLKWIKMLDGILFSMLLRVGI